MKYLLNLGAAGPAGDPRTLADLARLAEESGWDGVLLEDYLIYQGNAGMPTYDPWVALAAMAMVTSRIRLGTLVTPVSRRRPWKLAAEATALDHLSGGRMVLGVGAGDGQEFSFTASGEPTDQRTLARRLDEGLAIIDALWTGEPVTFDGREFSVDGLQLTPVPVQRPRIPIWVGGDWLRPGVRRRLTRWDGCCVYRGTPGGPDDAPMSAQDVRDVVALLERERGDAAGYDICIGGAERDSDEERERDHIRSLAEAGATWWNEWISPKDVSAMREAIARGPLRID